ncbi:MAG: hypothetical protein PHN56_00465 [Candidatus Nanoarchaeia archaeon]|nr:hypothetical protein [Candidatus Nanoarchaeia archaeon]
MNNTLNQKEKLSNESFNLYCDEYHDEENNYLVLGQMFIKKMDEEYVFNYLKNSRCLNKHNKIFYLDKSECKIKCDYHDKNFTPLHYSELDKSVEKSKIAINWINLLKNELTKKLFFKIFIVDLNKLDKKRFGSKNKIYNIYNKFFKISVGGIKKYLFGNKTICINKIIHHTETGLNNHTLFKYSSSLGLNKYNINILNNEIEFYSHNNRFCSDEDCFKKTHFIQLVDLIIGSFMELLIYKSKNEYKIKVAECLREIFENKKYKNYSVTFFPKYSIEELKNINQNYLNNENISDEEVLNRMFKFTQNFYNTFSFKMPKLKKENLGDFI